MSDLLASFKQPDQRSCGATCLVVARALLDDAYAARVEEPRTFREEVLAMHGATRCRRAPCGAPASSSIARPKRGGHDSRA